MKKIGVYTFLGAIMLSAVPLCTGCDAVMDFLGMGNSGTPSGGGGGGEAEYKITFDYNNSGETASITVSSSSKEMNDILAGVPEFTGCKFAGWYDKKYVDGSGQPVFPVNIKDPAERGLTRFNPQKITGDMTVYGLWRPIYPVYCFVTFDYNRESTNAQPESIYRAIIQGETFPQDKVPQNTGGEYKFMGWYTERFNRFLNKGETQIPSELEGKNFYSGGVINEDITIYALWKDANRLDLTLQYSDTKTVMAKVVFGDKAARPSGEDCVDSKGNQVAAWYKTPQTPSIIEWNAAIPNGEFDFDTEVINTEITLYALWKKSAPPRTVTFDFRDKMYTEEIQVPAGTTLSFEDIPATREYGKNIWRGWSLTAYGSNGDVFQNGDAAIGTWPKVLPEGYTVNENITFYSIWEAPKTYTVLFDFNGGKGVIDYMNGSRDIYLTEIKYEKKTSGTMVGIPTPTAIGSKKAFEFNDEMDNGGKYCGPRFAGWSQTKFTENGGVVRWYANNPTLLQGIQVSVNEDKTYYAVWRENNDIIDTIDDAKFPPDGKLYIVLSYTPQTTIDLPGSGSINQPEIAYYFVCNKAPTIKSNGSPEIATNTNGISRMYNESSFDLFTLKNLTTGTKVIEIVGDPAMPADRGPVKLVINNIVSQSAADNTPTIKLTNKAWIELNFVGGANKTRPIIVQGGSKLEITGGSGSKLDVRAKNNSNNSDDYPAIGSRSQAGDTVINSVIIKGNIAIEAYGGYTGPGIGWLYGTAGELTIKDSANVKAIAGEKFSAGLGGGSDTLSGKITITGASVVHAQMSATRNANNDYDIGGCKSGTVSKFPNVTVNTTGAVTGTPSPQGENWKGIYPAQTN
ncbi:MAG: InlB B-repeat-containing protein [Spirochaetaceae bacterium]|nr:InlB B-repeat-containing protein [Spirochaetaceae bacterium]